MCSLDIFVHNLALKVPKIVNNLSDQRVNVSDSTMLMCEATGTPNPIITWTKDNQTVLKGSGEKDFYEYEYISLVIKKHK